MHTADRFSSCCASRIIRRALLVTGLGLSSATGDARALDVVPTFLEANTGFGAIHVISGDGRRVIYESTSDPVGGNADGNYELFLWDPGLGLSQITTTTGTSFYWEVDIDQTGQTVEMVADADVTGAGATNTELYRWVDGGGWTRLTTTSGALDEVFTSEGSASAPTAGRCSSRAGATTPAPTRARRSRSSSGARSAASRRSPRRPRAAAMGETSRAT